MYPHTSGSPRGAGSWVPILYPLACVILVVNLTGFGITLGHTSRFVCKSFREGRATPNGGGVLVRQKFSAYQPSSFWRAPPPQWKPPLLEQALLPPTPEIIREKFKMQWRPQQAVDVRNTE